MPSSNDPKAVGDRILTCLENEGKAGSASPTAYGRRFSRRNAIIALLVILGAGASIAAYQVAVFSQPPSAATVAEKVESTPTVALAMASTTPLTTNVKPDTAVASIINEPAPVINNAAQDEASLGSAFQSLNSLPAIKVQDKTHSTLKASNKPKQLASAAPHKNHIAPRKSGAHALTVASKHGVSHPRAASRSAHSPTKLANVVHKKQAAKKQVVDGDTALLAAILAHDAGRQPAPQASAATNVKTGGRNRDIVERKPSDSSEKLLHRCKQLGLLEGELCRLRICADRWTTDSACKSSS